MERVKNMLVALDLSSHDNHLINYSSYLAEKLEVENVYFIHNIKKYEFSELFEQQVDHVNLDEILGDELNEKIENQFKANTNWEVLISEDSNTESLINYIANKYQINLTLVGNKHPSKGTGVVTSKLLRLLKSSILSIPENATFPIKKIWVGTDFSNPSRKSFVFIDELRQKAQAHLSAVHFYRIPLRFSPQDTREEVVEKVKKHIQQKSTKFLSKIPVDAPDETAIMYTKDKSISQRFIVEIEKQQPDLVVVSDKGGNNISSLLIGSLTEELFNEHTQTALLIVK